MDANKKLRETVITKMQSGDFEIKPCPMVEHASASTVQSAV